MPIQQLPITSPIKGVVRAVNREGQPPETCWDALNCLPYDRYGRKRLAQRPGLSKQFATQMAANFVQGMIEAPNIIYPPNGISTPIGSVDDLVDPFTFTDTNAGPFTHSYPHGGGTIYEWDFTVNYAATATPSMMAWSATPATHIDFYWNLDGTSTGDLILSIDASANLVWSGGGAGPTTINLSLWRGNVTLSSGTWTQVTSFDGPNISVTPAAGDVTTSLTAVCKILINNNGHVTIAIDGGTPASTTKMTGLTQSQFPELGCQDVQIDNTMVSGATVSQTVTVTD